MISLLLFFSAFFAMEAVAWMTHKYVMHGLLWKIHEDHHKPASKVVQKNDLFFLVFALPGVALIYSGTTGNPYHLALGTGITFYGLCYFLIHDLFIHQRLKFFRTTKNRYLLALRKAHKAHHKHLSKEEGECFGMLLVPLKFYKNA